MNRDTLLTIRREDPSGWIFSEPKDSDYTAFANWVAESFGPNALTEYYSQWDTADSF